MPLLDLDKITLGLSKTWSGFLRDWDRSLRAGNYPETTRYNYLLAAAQLARCLEEYSSAGTPRSETWVTEPNTGLTASGRTITAMTGMARRVRAVRGRLARLVAVLAVLGGLGLAVGLQCTVGMTAAMSMTHGVSSAGAAQACGLTMPASDAQQRVAPSNSGQLAMECVSPAAGGSVAPMTDDSPNPGGVLATCLAFGLVVLAAVVTLRPGPFRRVVWIFGAAVERAIRDVRLRAPSLAELCLSRT